MKRVMIVGGPGSGKSTLARALGERTGLPVHHMDRIHYEAGWIERPKAEKSALTREVHARDRWIFEGGHSTTYAERMARADTLVWLDMPLGRRLVRVLRRTWRHRGTARPDLADGCLERFDHRTLAFLWFVVRISRRSREKILVRLREEVRPELRVVRLTDDEAIADFIDGVAKEPDGVHGADVDDRGGESDEDEDDKGETGDESAGGGGNARDERDRRRAGEAARETMLHDPTPVELDAIHRLGRDAWGEGVSESAYLDACRGSDKYRRGTWHARRDGGRVVSALIVYDGGFDLPEGCHGIGSIATAKDARGDGHAFRLLRDVLSALERSGSDGVFLFADIETSLYARCGFVEVGRESGPSCLWKPFGSNESPPSVPGYF